MDGQGNLERLGKSGKVRNLKINSHAVVRNLFILFKRGKAVLSHETV